MYSEHPFSQALAIFNTIISVASGFVAFISIGDVQAIGGLIATVIATASGCMAIRYYYFAIKEKKHNLKNK